MEQTSSITVITPRSLTEAKEMAQTLSLSKLLPEALAKSPADILAVVMSGAELGLAPMQSIRAIHIIKGKPTLSADAMAALVQSSPLCEYLMLVETTPERAEYEAKRRGHPKPTRIAFTMADAQRAGLVSAGGNYAKYPAQMLRARCLAGICRAVFPDLVLGIYDPDELADVPEVREVRGETVRLVPPPSATPPPPQGAEDMTAALQASIDEAKAKAAANGEPPLEEQLAIAIGEAQSETHLNALVPRLKALGEKHPQYSALRLAWGARRDALKKAAAQ